MKSLIVIAGELSGDMHAAGVVRELRARAPGLHAWGIGGDRLREAGMEVLVDAREMAVVGFWEVLKRYGFFRDVFHRMLREVDARRPDAVLLIDYPGFNLRFAAQMKKRGVKVLYYVCPQVWAWHRSRIAKMARIIDRLMVIFPFEVDVFKGTSLRVDYVGHPLVEVADVERAARRDPLPWGGSPKLLLMPGSRRQEVQRILPAQWGAAARLAETFPDLGCLVAAASPAMAEQVRAVLAASGPGPARAAVVEGVTRQALVEADAVLLKSGTSTLEAALLGCPMVIAYKTSTMTYELGRRLIRVPHLGMANLILGREAFVEKLQHDATPELLAAAAAPLLTDTPERRAAVAATQEIRRILGDGGAAKRVADIVCAETGPGA